MREVDMTGTLRTECLHKRQTGTNMVSFLKAIQADITQYVIIIIVIINKIIITRYREIHLYVEYFKNQQSKVEIKC